MIVIFFQLRNVLGRRTGSERPPFDPYSARKQDKAAAAGDTDNVVALPRNKRGEAAAETYASIDALTRPETELNKGLRANKDAEASFEPKGFVDGAKMA